MIPDFIYNQTDRLDKIQQSLPGSFRYLAFIKVQDVQYLGAINPTTGTIAQVVFKPGKNGHAGWYAPNQKHYSETQKRGDAGPYIEVKVRCFYPFYDTESSLEFNSMMSHDWILSVEDYAGDLRIIGSLENPAKFSHSFDSGAGPRDVPGTWIEFTWQTERKPPIFKPDLGSEPFQIGGGTDPDPAPFPSS